MVRVHSTLPNHTPTHRHTQRQHSASLASDRTLHGSITVAIQLVIKLLFPAGANRCSKVETAALRLTGGKPALRLTNALPQAT